MKIYDVIYYKDNRKWELKWFHTISRALEFIKELGSKYNKITIKKSWI